MFSVSDTKSAHELSQFIAALIADDAITVTDGCACVGGNTISFARTFERVNSIVRTPSFLAYRYE